MGLGKFWPNLEISEPFVIGLEVSFSDDFASRSLDSFLSLGLEFRNRGLSFSNLPLYTPGSHDLLQRVFKTYKFSSLSYPQEILIHKVLVELLLFFIT